MTYLSSPMSPSAPHPVRSKSRALAVALLAGAVISSACADTPKAADVASTPAGPTLAEFANPAGEGSMAGAFTLAPNGRLYLSWQEQLPDSSVVLRYATRNTGDTTWSATRTVNTGRNIQASSGDVPTVHEQANGSLVAIWRGNHGEAGYDVVMAHSTDSGATWSTPKSPHGDVTPTEHGFVSWLQLGDSASIVWLDGRLNAQKDRAKQATQMALASLTPAGATNHETMIEPKICDCCHTSSAIVPGGAAVVYRDRDEGEIRDISVIRLAADGWRTPVRVHNDNWHIAGCPVNGPAISARGTDVAVAWFTGAADTARVRVAFSDDTASSFSKPIEINEAFPDGKVGVALTSRDRAIVSWIERKGTMAVLRVRAVNRDGTRSPATDVAELGEGKRAGGAPKLIVQGENVLLAWTDLHANRVKTALVKVQ